MAISLFDILNEICYHKSDIDFDDPEISKAYDVYMINRFLSTVEIFLPAIQDLNEAHLPKQIHYNFLRTVIPKGMYQFDYPKKTKNEDAEIIESLARLLEVGIKEATEYLKIIDDKTIKRLTNVFKRPKNE